MLPAELRPRRPLVMHKHLFGVAMLLVLLGQCLAEDYLYVADHNNKKVIKIKMDGTLVWEAPNGNGHDVQLLPNKNILINNGNTVEEITPDKKVVWKVAKPIVMNAESAQRLPNGNTVIADNGPMKVIEIDKDMKVVWEFAVP